MHRGATRGGWIRVLFVLLLFFSLVVQVVAAAVGRTSRSVEDGGVRVDLGSSRKTRDSLRAYLEHCWQPDSALMELVAWWYLPRFEYHGKNLFKEGGRVGFVERGLEILGAYVAPVVRALHSPNS